MASDTIILNSADITETLAKMAQAIVSSMGDQNANAMALVGIQTRGVYLALRLAPEIKRNTGVVVPVGSLDISFYRDDIGANYPEPLVKETKLDFDITGKTIVLVDDVLFTGRTVRAALDALMDYGRPKRVLLAILVDRGHREVPVSADFVGRKIVTELTDAVDVFLTESDNKDEVIVRQKT